MTIVVHEDFSKLVKLQVTLSVSKLLLTFWSTVKVSMYTTRNVDYPESGAIKKFIAYRDRLRVYTDNDSHNDRIKQ